jgi:beta-lactamase class A
MFKKTLVCMFVLSLFANIALLYYLYNNNLFNPGNVATQSTVEQLPYLSKRIFTEKQNDILINFVPLRSAARDYIEAQKEEIGYYFEYLPSGTSIGINEKMEIRIASLIKVPVVMAFYKLIEEGKLSEDTELTVREKDINIDFGNLWRDGPNSKISVKEAILLSIIESDNTAARVLNSNLPEGAIDDVYDSLDIPKNFADGYPIISPKNYTSILRSLYLSSYLIKEYSNEILDILTRTKFSDMLPAGVDKEIKVAHKIGIYDTQKVFSDCGIIYVPDRPYTLCIMVKGSQEQSREHISLLSKMAFEYVSKIYR